APPREAARRLGVRARAVEPPHRHGVAHRDLKPQNVRPASDEGPASPDGCPFGVPKIADFGLAKRLDVEGGQTRSGTIVGTPQYMAPEQASGKVHQVGPHTDVYALGAILYQCLTGRPPPHAPP